jgi:hypothetical protein
LLDEDLVLGRCHLVKCEFNLPNKIVLLKVSQVVEVINIVHDCLELLDLLELVGDLEVLDPLRVQVVHDDLSHPDHGPHVAFLLVEHYHPVGTSEGIHVGEVLACEREFENLL